MIYFSENKLIDIITHQLLLGMVGIAVYGTECIHNMCEGLRPGWQLLKEAGVSKLSQS